MMQLSISRCSVCSKKRLVDMAKERVCFACKQKVRRPVLPNASVMNN